MRNRVWSILAFSITVAILSLITAASAESCSEPSKPYCAEDYGSFSDQSEYEDCRSEMDSFKSETEDYLECLKRAADEASDEYQEAVDSFNNRVRNRY